jgi:hypothetical protein
MGLKPYSVLVRLVVFADSKKDAVHTVFTTNDEERISVDRVKSVERIKERD